MSFFQLSILFDLLARSFSYPYKLADMRQTAELVPKAKSAAAEACPEALAPLEEFADVLESVRDVEALTAVEVEFVDLDKPVNAFVYSPHESIQRSGYYDMGVVSDVRRFYVDAGMKPRPGAEPDHIATELAFLSALFYAASQKGDEAAKFIDAFWEEHVESWMLKYAERLSQSGFKYFAPLGKLLSAALKCYG